MAEQLRRRGRPVEDRDVVSAVYQCTPAGTVKVAELLGVSRQAADAHLRRLESAGRI